MGKSEGHPWQVRNTHQVAAVGVPGCASRTQACRSMLRPISCSRGGDGGLRPSGREGKKRSGFESRFLLST